MWSKLVRQLLPIPTLVGSYRYWRQYGARIRRARVFYQYAAGLTRRRVHDWEKRSLRLFRRAIIDLKDLTTGLGDGPPEWARSAHLALRLARAPYRTLAAALARLLGVVAALALVVLLTASALSPGIRGRLFPRDLAQGRRWTACSSDDGMPKSGVGPSSNGNMFFHTTAVDRAWVEIDLGAEHAIRGLLVMNRADCCQERALPLNFEIFDGTGWRLVAQRRVPFATWKYDVDP
ncbi:MAG TPA: hypothetical protein VF524_07510, partial [Polyangia bacterium]